MHRRGRVGFGVALIHRLRKRKIVQWALAYLAGAWLLLQVLDLLRENFGWSEIVVRGGALLLVIGFLMALVVAWYHGEKGRQRASPVELLLLAVLLVAAGVTLSAVRRGGLGAAPDNERRLSANAVDPRSIAVLPFENQSGDADNEYFSIGITDDVITHLAQIRGLKVISRTSVMRFRDPADRSLPEIGHELGAAVVLEGGVRRSGDRVRITAQLIDTRTDTHLWAQAFDRALTVDDIFDIQTEIAGAITRALEAHLDPEDRASRATRPTSSLAAYDLYSRARYLQDQRTVESRWAAIDLYRQALAEDPNFALAHAGLATAYLGLLVRGSIPHAEAMAQARPIVDRALQLNPDLPEAHAALGFLLERGEGRYEEARVAYRRAIVLNPGYAAAHAALGTVALNLGDLEEARRELQLSVELDPLALPSRAMLGLVAGFSRDNAEAEAQALRILELDPEFAYGHYLLAYALSDQGRQSDAIAAMSHAYELDPRDLDVLAGLAIVHARAGHQELALALADSVERKGGPFKEIALILAQLGEIDRAFEYLERAYRISPGELSLIRLDPYADPLREDPRWAAFLERLARPNE